MHPAVLLVQLSLGLPAPAPANVTFTEHVAPILFAHCASCHRPGEAAPFPLLSYADARKKARMIQRVTDSRFMPPWHAEPGHVPFADERRLTEAQIATLKAWVDAGAPEGDPGKLPPLPKFPEGWQLGTPDLVVSMKAAFEVPASGGDIYRNFVLPLGLTEDQWVVAVELRPSARSVVHHSLFFLDDTGRAREADGKDGKPGFRGMSFGAQSLVATGGRRSGSLGGWAVGGTPRRLPMDLAMPLPKGSDLVLQTHFHPSGKAEREQTTVGLYFSKKPPTRTMVPIQLPPFFGATWGIDIPAGEKHYTVKDSITLPVAVDAVLVGGHAHYLCTTMHCTAKLPDGSEQVLLAIPRWDFNWQDHYAFQKPVRLPKGTVLTMELVYDNSADNPANPHSPPRRVRWGRESNDEMGSMTLQVVPADEAELPLLQRGVRAAATRTPRGAGRLVAGIADRIMDWDRNQDGKVEESEVPERFRRFLDQVDLNGDRVVTKDEIEALKKESQGGGEARK
jgi:hypothetical protein